MEPGRFCLVPRDDEWDEVLLAARLQGNEWLVRTTDAVGEFGWSHLELVEDDCYAFNSLHGNRRAPPVDYPPDRINGIFVGAEHTTRWGPTVPEVLALCFEAQAIAELVQKDPAIVPQAVGPGAEELRLMVVPRRRAVPAVAQPRAGVVPPLPPPEAPPPKESTLPTATGWNSGESDPGRLWVQQDPR